VRKQHSRIPGQLIHRLLRNPLPEVQADEQGIRYQLRAWARLPFLKERRQRHKRLGKRSVADTEQQGTPEAQPIKRRLVLNVPVQRFRQRRQVEPPLEVLRGTGLK